MRMRRRRRLIIFRRRNMSFVSNLRSFIFKSLPAYQPYPITEDLSLRPPFYFVLFCVILVQFFNFFLVNKNYSRMTQHWLLAIVVETRNGYLFCQKCNDYVFDPRLEKYRIKATAKPDDGRTYTKLFLSFDALWRWWSSRASKPGIPHTYWVVCMLIKKKKKNSV